MRFLRTNTAVIITVGPFYDKTTGVDIETGLTITNERITLTADTDEGSAPTNILDNVTGATSGTANDLNYITGNDAGMMQIELSAANTNRLGRMFLSITDAANHVPVFHEFMILTQNVYDAFFVGSDILDVSVTQIAGATVSTSTAQLGVNAVQAGGTAWGSGAITAASIATDAITAAKIAADAIGASELAADAVTEIQSGLATAAALTTVDDFLDTEIAAILAAVDTEIAAIKAKTDLIPGTIDGKTFSELVTLIAAVLLGKASGLETTTAVYRAVDDSKNRVTAAVTSAGNRTAVSMDAS